MNQTKQFKMKHWSFEANEKYTISEISAMLSILVSRFIDRHQTAVKLDVITAAVILKQSAVNHLALGAHLL